jgi:four helix bundle protein
MDFSDLEILKLAEQIADAIWQRVVKWDSFAKNTVGRQLARSADSIGANIAEAYGRFHYGEKSHFFYYARGSIFETKFWLNRSLSRRLLDPNDAQNYLDTLTELAKRLNRLVAVTKSQPRIREEAEAYTTQEVLFSSEELNYLETLDN